MGLWWKWYYLKFEEYQKFIYVKSFFLDLRERGIRTIVENATELKRIFFIMNQIETLFVLI